jgi:peroxiredoxin
MNRIAAILFSMFLFAGCINEDAPSGDVKVGDRLPAFEVIMNDGTLVTDGSLMGKVSVVMFFHTSCPDCRQALPRVQEIYDEYVQKDVLFALIGRECTEDEIRVHWEENSLDMPYSAQNDRSVYNMFASSRIPRIYISDENGTVRYIFTDDPVATVEDLRSSLDILIR